MDEILTTPLYFTNGKVIVKITKHGDIFSSDGKWLPFVLQRYEKAQDRAGITNPPTNGLTSEELEKETKERFYIVFANYLASNVNMQGMKPCQASVYTVARKKFIKGRAVVSRDYPAKHGVNDTSVDALMPKQNEVVKELNNTAFNSQFNLQISPIEEIILKLREFEKENEALRTTCLNALKVNEENENLKSQVREADLLINNMIKNSLSDYENILKKSGEENAKLLVKQNLIEYELKSVIHEKQLLQRKYDDLAVRLENAQKVIKKLDLFSSKDRSSIKSEAELNDYEVSRNAFNNALDGSIGFHERRESGKFGSLSSFDNYSDEYNEKHDQREESEF